MPRALLSVYDKTGIVELATGLRDLGFDLVSTGGTHDVLTRAGLAVQSVSDVTGFPEILDGRVKTLHPAVHGGLLGRVDLADHRETMRTHGIVPIDLLAVNLYPFEATVARADVLFDDAVEQIDIGGPAMLRSAAKNMASVTVLTDPSDYADTLHKLSKGDADLEWRRGLAAKAFRHVAHYDSLIARFLDDGETLFPDELTIPARRTGPDLRYGENPHQAAAAYRLTSVPSRTCSVLDAEILGGKALSFNNLLDADAAMSVVASFGGPACAVIKHTIPCGVAVSEDPASAVVNAIASDPVSAFGGIVALNREVDDRSAAILARTFFEVILAPSFSAAALDRLRTKPNLRLLALPDLAGTAVAADGPGLDARWVRGGVLLQQSDIIGASVDHWSTVTSQAPSERQRADLAFAWTVVAHAKSNAIALAKDGMLVGLGCGQPNRLDAVRHAVERAGDRAGGAVLASDAFFPFADGIEAAAGAGIVAVVQPGGSVRDPEVIAAAQAAGIAMMFTGERHFRH